jgi:O-Antigen ligase
MTKKTNYAESLTSSFSCACLVTATGFDVLSFNILSSNIRFAYVIFFIVFLCLKEDIYIEVKRQKIIYSLLLLFVLFSLPSIFESTNFTKSLIYPLWVLLNYLFVFVIFAFLSCKENSKEKLFNGIIISFRFQVLVSLFFFFLKIGISERVSLFYYEPSYFAFALTLYISTIVYRFNGRLNSWVFLDIVLVFIAFLTTQSFNLILILLLCLTCSLLVGQKNRNQQKNTLALLFGILLMYLFVYLYTQNIDDLISTRLRSALESDNILDYLSSAGGNRIPRKECAWAVFLQHKWFGVGIGAYDSYTLTTNIQECLSFLANDDLSPIGKPATNIYIEILSTVGILGSWPIFLFFAYIVFRKNFTRLDMIQSSYFTAVVSLLLLLMYDGNYMRLYLWMFLGIYYGSTLENVELKKHIF